MKVAVFGGTGFVGSYIAETLLVSGHIPRLLVRPGSQEKLSRQASYEFVLGDISSSVAMVELIQGVDAVIYNIGILREFPLQDISFNKLQFEGVVRAAGIAASQGVRRFILMSANGVEQSLTKYQRTKLAAEAHLQGLDMDWTVFRPSVIFGDPQGHFEFASMLKQQIIDSPLPVPLFHQGILPQDPGGFALSPVHVKDVASAFVGALERPETIRHTYTIGGPDDLSWKQILNILCEVSGKHKLMLPVPAAGPKFAATLLDRYTWFPISRDQILMLLAGNTCRGDEIFNLCGIEPKPFSEEHLWYLKPDDTLLKSGGHTLREIK